MNFLNGLVASPFYSTLHYEEGFITTDLGSCYMYVDFGEVSRYVYTGRTVLNKHKKIRGRFNTKIRRVYK